VAAAVRPFAVSTAATGYDYLFSVAVEVSRDAAAVAAQARLENDDRHQNEFQKDQGDEVGGRGRARLRQTRVAAVAGQLEPAARVEALEEDVEQADDDAVAVDDEVEAVAAGGVEGWAAVVLDERQQPVEHRVERDAGGGEQREQRSHRQTRPVKVNGVCN